MKSLLLSLALILSIQANAAQIELGKYTAVDTATKTIKATLELRANGTVNFKVTTPDFTMPEPGCEGKYTVVANQFNAELTCPTDLIPEVKVKIDITNVTAENLRSANGATVNVIVNALGETPSEYSLKKAD